MENHQEETRACNQQNASRLLSEGKDWYTKIRHEVSVPVWKSASVVTEGVASVADSIGNMYNKSAEFVYPTLQKSHEEIAKAWKHDYAKRLLHEGEIWYEYLRQESSSPSFWKSAASVTGGVACVAGGATVTVLTAGMGSSLGGALMGAGNSLVTHPISKKMAGEGVETTELLKDAAVGATIGALSGGIGATGGSLVQGASTAVKAGVQVAAGAASGAVGGAVIETARAIDGGVTSLQSLGRSMAVGAACGVVGGVSSLAASGLANGISSALGKAVARVTAQTASATATDAGIQLCENGGDVSHLDVKRLAATATSQLAVAGTFECAMNKAVKSQAYTDKLNKLAVDQDNLTAEERSLISERLKEANKLQQETIDGELKKVAECQKLQSEINELQLQRQNIEKIRADAELASHGLQDKAKPYLAESDDLGKSLRRVNQKIGKLVVELQEVKPAKYGENSLHFLNLDRAGQIAMDIPDENGNRGLRRVIADYDNGNKRFVYADYTENHDYDSVRRLVENVVHDSSTHGVGKLLGNLFSRRRTDKDDKIQSKL